MEALSCSSCVCALSPKNSRCCDRPLETSDGALNLPNSPGICDGHLPSGLLQLQQNRPQPISAHWRSRLFELDKIRKHAISVHTEISHTIPPFEASRSNSRPGVPLDDALTNTNTAVDPHRRGLPNPSDRVNVNVLSTVARGFFWTTPSLGHDSSGKRTRQSPRGLACIPQRGILPPIPPAPSGR